MPRKKLQEEEETQNLTPEEKAVDEMFEEQMGEKVEEQEEEVKTKGQEQEIEEKKEQEKVEEVEGKEKEEKQERKEEEKKEKEEEKPSKDQELLKKHGLTKFKTIDDALNSYKELESAYGRAQNIISSYQRGVIPQEIKEGVEGAINIVSRPRVKFEVPDPSPYELDDGTFDIRSYITDVLNNYTANLQRSLVFGELGSALYTVLSSSVVDKYSNLKQEIDIEKQADEIAQELRQVFPQLEKDDELAELFEGVVMKKYQEKQAPLTKEEFFDIAKKIVGLKYKTTQEKPTVETSGFTGQMGEKGYVEAPKSKEEQAIDEMFNEYLNKKSSGIF